MQCCTVLGYYVTITPATVTEWKLILGREIEMSHSVFRISGDFRAQSLRVLFWSSPLLPIFNTQTDYSPLNLPKSIIPFIPTPHKKVLSYVLVMCVLYVGAVCAVCLVEYCSYFTCLLYCDTIWSSFKAAKPSSNESRKTALILLSQKPYKIKIIFVQGFWNSSGTTVA